jgi:hypothetical protein
MSGPTDLADLFGPPPPGPAQTMMFRQGVVLTFDPATLSNTVAVGGAVLSNLPLLGVGEATLLTVGSVVGIVSITAPGGGTTWAILGRLVTPGSAQATDAVSLLSSNITAASVIAQETYASLDWGDLATVGPTVTVNVRAAGRLLVLCTALIQWTDAATNPNAGGLVTVEMTGASSIDAATASDTVEGSLYVAETGPTAETVRGTVTAQGVFSGLTPGSTTLTVKYQNQVAAKNIDYSRRTITAIVL